MGKEELGDSSTKPLLCIYNNTKSGHSGAPYFDVILVHCHLGCQEHKMVCGFGGSANRYEKILHYIKLPGNTTTHN